MLHQNSEDSSIADQTDELKSGIQLFDSNFYVSLLVLQMAFIGGKSLFKRTLLVVSLFSGLLFKDFLSSKSFPSLPGAIFSERIDPNSFYERTSSQVSPITREYREVNTNPNLPFMSVVKSKNTYVDIPLNAKTKSIDDYFYDDYDYDGDYDYLKYQPEENRASYVYQAPSADIPHSYEPTDQFIFPGRYVISQPNAGSTKYDRRLIIKLPNTTPPDSPLLGLMGVKLPSYSQDHQPHPIRTFQRIMSNKYNSNIKDLYSNQRFQGSPIEDRDITWAGSGDWVKNTVQK